jgi:hypothetical protein
MRTPVKNTIMDKDVKRIAIIFGVSLAAAYVVIIYLIYNWLYI